MSPRRKATSIADYVFGGLEGEPDVSFIDTIAYHTSVLSHEASERDCSSCSKVTVCLIAAILYSSQIDSGDDLHYTAGRFMMPLIVQRFHDRE